MDEKSKVKEKPIEEMSKENKKKPNLIDYTDGASSEFPHDSIDHVIKKLADAYSDTVYHEVTLPSNGKLGYPAKVEIREMTVNDEKMLLKGLHSNDKKAIQKLIKTCVKSEVDPEKFSSFDQEFLIVQLSAITFPGPKTYEIKDDQGNKVPVEITLDDLVCSEMSDDLEYPFVCELPNSRLRVFLNILSTEELSNIDKLLKQFDDDPQRKLFINIAKMIDRIEFMDTNGIIQLRNFYEYVKLFEKLKPMDIKKLSEFVENEILGKFGYSLKKEVWNPYTSTNTLINLEPLNFFRLSI